MATGGCAIDWLNSELVPILNPLVSDKKTSHKSPPEAHGETCEGLGKGIYGYGEAYKATVGPGLTNSALSAVTYRMELKRNAFFCISDIIIY